MSEPTAIVTVAVCLSLLLGLGIPVSWVLAFVLGRQVEREMKARA